MTKNKKMSKEEKEWLENPAISFNMVDGKLEIVGNPFDKAKDDKPKDKEKNDNNR